MVLLKSIHVLTFGKEISRMKRPMKSFQNVAKFALHLRLSEFLKYQIDKFYCMHFFLFFMYISAPNGNYFVDVTCFSLRFKLAFASLLNTIVCRNSFKLFHYTIWRLLLLQCLQVILLSASP